MTESATEEMMALLGAADFNTRPDTAKLKALLEAGADPNAIRGKANDKTSALELAVRCCCGSSVELLLAAGADVDRQTHIPVFNDDEEIEVRPHMSALMKAIEINAPRGLTDTRGHIISRLLRDADLDLRDAYGKTASEYTQARCDDYSGDKINCERLRRTYPGLFELVPEVRTWWPKPDAPVTDDVKSRFMSSCHNGSMDELKYMIHLFPDCVNWEHEGRTGLFSIIGHGGFNYKAAALFIAHGADVNTRDRKGATPLHRAAEGRNGQIDFIPLLLDNGADASILDDDGLDAAAHAEKYGCPDSAQMIRDIVNGRAREREARMSALRDSFVRGMKQDSVVPAPRLSLPKKQPKP